MFRTLIAGVLAAALIPAASAAAATISVSGAADIDGAGQATDPGGGSLPPDLSVTGGESLSFAVTGQVTLNGGGNYNDADGIGSAQGSVSTGYGSVSGITLPNAGALVGVFVPSGGPSGSAPASLTYTSGTTSSASYSPLLDQVFFIGDGLTGDGTGATQTFLAPSGASELYLGVADACGYNGPPSCFGDNSGTFSVAVSGVTSVGGVPEPSVWALSLIGVAMLGGALRVRRRGASLGMPAGAG